ncbi:MAG: DUF2723 domain-containing protein [bacterium]
MNNLLKKYFAEFTGLAVFIIYLFTLAPSVVQIDSGELAAVQSTLGIAHPTGYPLFTLLGYLFSKIPLPFTNIFKANLLAAIFCAAGAVFIIKSSYLILNNPQTKVKVEHVGKKSKEKKLEKPIVVWSVDETVKIFSSIFAGLVAAFSVTIWLQSTSVEVYSLHILLISLIIYFLLKAYFTPADDKNATSLKPWIIFTIFFALGFTNHMTTLLIIPGAILLFFMKEKFNVASFKKILYALPVFFGVLILLYLYLPIRASQSPTMNWSNPINWENFWRHLTGKQYQVWLFSSSESAKKQFIYFFNSIPVEFAYIGLVAIIIGFFYAIKRSAKIFWFILTSFVFTIIYSINYDIVDIDTYFILAYISLALFSAFGFVWLFEFFKSKKLATNFAIPILAVLLLVQFLVNFSKTDQSKLYAYEDYTKAILKSVKKNSIIFSYQWDYFVSASYYFQQVEDLRKDVTIIDKELLRRSWYFDQLKRNHPEVVAGIQKEIGLFRESLKPFEQEEVYNAAILESYYQDIMAKLISTNYDKHDYYIGPEIIENELRRGEFKMPEGYKLVPQLFMYKVTKSDEYIPSPDPNFTIRFPEEQTRYTALIRQMIAGVFINRALYEVKFNNTERAKLFVDKVKKEFPEQPLPVQFR